MGDLQAYFVIKAAQEREELNRQKEELEGKVEKAEHELEGLRTAANQLASSTSELSRSLRYDWHMLTLTVFQV
jgi:hypothetical protein